MTLALPPRLRSFAHPVLFATGLVCSACDTGVSVAPVGALQLSLADGASSGNNQRGRTGEALREPLRVLVTRDGVPVPGVDVVWYTTYGSIAASGPSDGSGVASATWTMPIQLYGSREARVALPNEPTSSVRFTAQPSHPTVELVSGGAQQGFVGLRLDQELADRVTWDGVPLSGRAVHWSGPEVEESAGATDADGVVRGRWRLGPVAGQQTTRLQLSPHAFDGPQAVFGATAKPGAAAAMSLVSVQDYTGTWLRGRSGVVPVSAMVSDHYGNPVPQADIAWVLVTSEGEIAAQMTLVTDQAGRSWGQIPLDSIDAQGDFSITASLSGVPSLHRVFTVVDALMMDDGWGSYLDPQVLTVPVGTTVSWGNRSSAEHLLSLVTPLSDTTVAIGETLGPLWPNPGQVLTHRFLAPGTYVVDCITPGHWWERVTIHVTP
jgi:plastocyanin